MRNRSTPAWFSRQSVPVKASAISVNAIAAVIWQEWGTAPGTRAVDPTRLPPGREWWKCPTGCGCGSWSGCRSHPDRVGHGWCRTAQVESVEHGRTGLHTPSRNAGGSALTCMTIVGGRELKGRMARGTREHYLGSYTPQQDLSSVETLYGSLRLGQIRNVVGERSIPCVAS